MLSLSPLLNFVPTLSNPGVILPSEILRIPFVFKSERSGVYTEQWLMETRPVLCGGAELVLTLRGVALQEDTYQKQREELEVSEDAAVYMKGR